jgi:hypothetical protein
MGRLQWAGRVVFTVTSALAPTAMAMVGTVFTWIKFHFRARPTAPAGASDPASRTGYPDRVPGGHHRRNTHRVYALMVRVGANRDGRERFFRTWLQRHASARAVIGDTTSLSTYAADLQLAELGYNRDQEKLAPINPCLVADRATGLPLW